MSIGTITIHFWGICTFMRHDQVGVPDSLAWGRRYVLVDASDHDVIHNSFGLNGHGIQPHHAQLQIAVEDLVTITDTDTPGFTTADPPIFIPQPPAQPNIAWDLNNVLLSIANPLPPPLNEAHDPGGNPGFPNLSAGIDGVMPPASLPMTLNTVPTRAACFFDFFHGDLIAVQTLPGAIIGRLTVETIGNPQIRVNSFAEGGGVINIELRSGSEVVVGNGPQTKEEDSDQDFRLHYLTASRFPDVVRLPERNDLLPHVETYNPPRWDTNLMLTVGCSNSTYP
jgi:hypothetical protein